MGVAAAQGAVQARPGSIRFPKACGSPRRRSRKGATPVVLADHSDRSGSATWLLQQVIEQDLDDVLFATIADRKAVRR